MDSDSVSPPEPPEEAPQLPPEANPAREMMVRMERMRTRHERMRQVVELHLAGVHPLEIAKTLGLGRGNVHSIIRVALKQTAAQFSDVTALRACEAMRLDRIQAALWPKVADPKVADTIIRAMERRASLYGLDAPEAMRLLPPESPPTDIDVDRLSPDEALFLRNIMLRQQSERNAINVESHVVSETGAMERHTELQGPISGQ